MTVAAWTSRGDSAPPSLKAAANPEAWTTIRGPAVAASMRRVSGHDRCPANRSLTATIARAGGVHPATPHRSPATTGVAAPIIPRTNR